MKPTEYLDWTEGKAYPEGVTVPEIIEMGDKVRALLEAVESEGDKIIEVETGIILYTLADIPAILRAVSAMREKLLE